MRRGRFWRRIHRGIVVGPLWVWSVWFAMVMVLLVFGLIAWGLASRPLPLPKEALSVPPPPKVMVLEVTGYSQSVEEGTADGITAFDLPVARGMAAADPAVLPPGTVILVPGYGYALVGDVGSAIKGNRLDLFFPTREEAFQWGRQTVVAQVIRPGEGLE